MALVAYLSLFLKRGALPLGYVLSHVIGSVIMLPLMFLMFFAGARAWSTAIFTWGMPVFNAVIYLVASVVCYRLLMPRLECLAGES